jgi:hypothetical protein
MSYRMTRRELLQWLGGATAGCMLSPMPFALIDDLTIATQTRGRPHALPSGQLDRFRTRCPGCPAGCEIEVLTVGGQPYLCVPAPDAERIGACAVLPALHQLHLHRRLRHPHLAGHGPVSADRARDLVLEWIDGSERVAGVDPGLPGRGATALSLLAGTVPGAVHVFASNPRSPLGALERGLGLGPDVELAVDVSRIHRIVPIGPGSRADDPTMRRLVAALDGAARGECPHGLAPGSVVLSGRDGVGGRIDPEVEEIAVAANVACCALDANGPIVARRRLPGTSRPADDLEDQSLDLLLVDASRAWQAIPWKRLRRKLIPGRGRLVVFSPWSSAATAYADLVLPTAAPLEAEEFVGGDDRHPELRLGLCRPVATPAHPLVGPLEIARERDPASPGPVEATALALLADPDGHLCDPASGSLHGVPDDPDALVEQLRQGKHWRGSMAGAVALPHPASLTTIGVASAATRRHEGIRIRLDAPVLAGAGVPLPPVLGKLSRESRLVAPAGSVRVHPRTLAHLGLLDGTTRHIRTNRGEFPGSLIEDPSVEPDTLVVNAGFDPEGFAEEARDASELLGQIDVDPGSDTPDGWQLLEVI